MAYSNEESIKELFVFIYFSVSWNLNKVFSKKKPFLIGKKDCCLDTACYSCEQSPLYSEKEGRLQIVDDATAFQNTYPLDNVLSDA